jgi:hypothetical protein
MSIHWYSWPHKVLSVYPLVQPAAQGSVCPFLPAGVWEWIKESIAKAFSFSEPYVEEEPPLVLDGTLAELEAEKSRVLAKLGIVGGDYDRRVSWRRGCVVCVSSVSVA